MTCNGMMVHMLPCNETARAGLRSSPTSALVLQEEPDAVRVWTSPISAGARPKNRRSMTVTEKMLVISLFPSRASGSYRKSTQIGGNTSRLRAGEL